MKIPKIKLELERLSAKVLVVALQLYGTKWFWIWIFGLLFVGLATHLMYRQKTQGWKKPWGGWKDVEAS